MSIQEILASSGGALVILMTLMQIAPIKVNPWSAIGKMIGKALNGDVIVAEALHHPVRLRQPRKL